MAPTSDDNREVTCDVCSEPTTIFSVGKCDHPICYKCATRMRVLCEHTYCPICRAELPKIVFTRKLHEFHKVNTSHYPVNRKQRIYFEDGAIQDAYYELLQHSCSLCEKQKFSSFHALQNHMKRDHELFFCDLCTKDLKNFSHERKSYSRQDLARHRRVGDADDTSHKGHPLCEFCDVRYLDNDELARHLRKDHFFCHFCDADGLQHYYLDYNLLREHFKEDHFLCEEGECRDVQFTNAFRAKIDYQAHVTQEHGKNMKKSQARQARTLDIEFSLAPRPRERDRGVITGLDYEESKGGGRGRGRGRGHQRGARQNQKDEEALSQALAASQAELEAGYKEEVHDFPSLNETRTAAQGEQNNSDSMAKTFARLNNMSVQEGSMASEDFPTLGGGAPPKQYPHHPKQQVWTKSKSSPQLPKKSAKANAQNSAAWGLQGSMDDFPVLESNKRQYSAPQSYVPKPAPKVSKPDVKPTPKPQKQQPQKPKPKPASMEPEDDFPSLGVSTASFNKIQVMAPAKPQKQQPQKQPKLHPANMEDDFPSLGGSSATFNKNQVAAPARPQRPQPQKQPKPQPTSIEDDFPSLGSSSPSFNKIQVAAPARPQKPQPQKQPKPQPTSIEDDFPTLGVSSASYNKVQVAAPAPSKKASKKQKPKPVFEDDFPTLGGSSAPNAQHDQLGSNLAAVISGKKHSLSELAHGISPATNTQKTLNLKGDDFPSLGGGEVANDAPEWKAVPKKAKSKRTEKKPSPAEEPVSIPGAVFSDVKKQTQKDKPSQKEKQSQKLEEKPIDSNQNCSDSVADGQKDKKKKKKKKKGEKDTSPTESPSSLDTDDISPTETPIGNVFLIRLADITDLNRQS